MEITINNIEELAVKKAKRLGLPTPSIDWFGSSNSQEVYINFPDMYIVVDFYDNEPESISVTVPTEEDSFLAYDGLDLNKAFKVVKNGVLKAKNIYK